MEHPDGSATEVTQTLWEQIRNAHFCQQQLKLLDVFSGHK